MQIEVLADPDAVAGRAAALIAKEARTAAAERRRFVMAVSGGHAPWIMLRVLAGQDHVPWSDMHVFQGDKRIAPQGDADRNFTHLSGSLLKRSPLPPAQVYPMPWKISTSPLRPNVTPRRCARSQDRRRHSILSTWALGPRATPPLWSRTTQFLGSLT
jgi:6-phosphogluconolactonase/glucosamine-6-phosphate isomerase/deaminase